MRPEERDESLIWDIRKHAAEAVELTAGYTPEDFFAESVRDYAIKYVLMTIGEAARSLSEDFKRGRPEIPWETIIGLRNRLAHDYGNLEPERLWTAATEDCPALIRALEPLIPDIDV